MLEASQNHRITELLRLEASLETFQSQSPSQSRVSWSGLPRIMASWVFSISNDGDSTTSLATCCSV